MCAKRPCCGLGWVVPAPSGSLFMIALNIPCDFSLFSGSFETIRESMLTAFHFFRSQVLASLTALDVDDSRGQESVRTRLLFSGSLGVVFHAFFAAFQNLVQEETRYDENGELPPSYTAATSQTSRVRSPLHPSLYVRSRLHIPDPQHSFGTTSLVPNCWSQRG